MTAGPLYGIRVLDLTRAVAGPLCTMVLGDLGADVIKVEMPVTGDETRFWGPPFAGDAGPTLLGFNRNKRSVALDLHTEDGRRACLKLAQSCDVFVENFRPGTIGRFGLGYDALRAVQPDIVYCSISGYGQTGPMAHRPAIDLMVQAVSGLMSQTGEPMGLPMKAAAPVADVMGALSAAISIMGALTERAATGIGRYLDIGMLDGMIALMGQAVAVHGMNGKSPERYGNAHPLMAPYESFRTQDREIVLGITNEKNWAALCSIPDFGGLANDPQFATPPLRSTHRERLITAFSVVLKMRPAAHWLATFDAVGIPAEQINSLAEILAHPQTLARQMLLEVEYPPDSEQRYKVAGMPWRAVASNSIRNPPTLGQHTQEVLHELGLA